MAILFAAGETVTAGKLNRLQPTTYRAVGSGTVAASSVNAPITGCTVSITTQAANAHILVYGVFAGDMTVAGTGIMQGFFYVDGVLGAASQARYSENSTSGESTVTQVWKAQIPTAGVHTVDLRVTTGAGVTVVGAYSTITVVVYEQN